MTAPGLVTDRWAAPAPGECHLWQVAVRPQPGPGTGLDPVERRQAARYLVAAARDVFVTSRTAQRLIGSGYLGIPPHAVVTDRSCEHCGPGRGGAGHGRPRFPGAPVQHSVSHTLDWLMIVVSADGPVGVDVEALASLRDIDGLAATMLAPAERARFARVAPAERARWLLVAWTRKEAAMKLTGLGLAAAPHLIDVSGPTAVATEVPRWPAAVIHLRALDAPHGHAAALATTEPVTVVRHLDLASAATEGR